MTAQSLSASPAVQTAMVYVTKCGAVIKKVPVKRWRQLLLFFVALWLCHSLARLFWVVVPVPDQVVSPVIPKMTTSHADVTPVSINLATINDLFGVFDPQSLVAVQPKEPEIDPANVPITQLNLKLQGVIASNEPARSWAIIGEASSQKLYKIGDAIPGARNVKLRDIADLWVVLDNNGKSEKLWLYGEDGTKIAAAPRVRNTRPQPKPKDDRIVKEISQDQLAEAKSIGDVVRFMVATENGQMIGYKVRPGRKRELFDQVGLKNNDIVVSVNGIEVNEPQKVREVYQALKTATEANLEVMRDGSTQFIQIRMSSG
ncbi:type II secretion system protein GspC [Marinagarivorans algicola]|uniref:type II secretion system protein GspC n=1 Tax=Marinagarivorans algicola TaxID=1513270 RepID=UPI0006B62176|nr:type II secretion system protein GspC [Marinagarivorans algicola]